jgi:tetratricopeptide (TPR) repeat protein
MSEVNLHAVERYQSILAKDPKSLVFAPLADNYRKLGLLKEAKAVALEGLRYHPHHAGGRVALAQVLVEIGELEAAQIEADKALKLSPDNVLAHHLKAETLLRLNRPKEALKAYKTLLFLAPDNERAQKAIKKLESLTADEFDTEVFQMRPLKALIKEWDNEIEIEAPEERESRKKRYMLDRIISLADAYLSRQEPEKALEVLTQGEAELGPEPDIIKRLKILHSRSLETISYPKTTKEFSSPPPERPKDPSQAKIERLQSLKNRFQAKRFTSKTP